MFKSSTKAVCPRLFSLLTKRQERHRAITWSTQKDNKRTYWNYNSDLKGFLYDIHCFPPASVTSRKFKNMKINNIVLNFIELVLIIRPKQWIRENCIISWASSTARVEQSENWWTMENPTQSSCGKCLKYIQAVIQ